MKIHNYPALVKVWDEVVEKYGFPNIEPPELYRMPNETAFINLDTLDIKIGYEFLQGLNMSFVDGFKAVSAHELAHHVVHPYDLKTCFEVVKVMKNAGNSKNPSSDQNLFADVIVNIDLVDRGVPEIAQVYQNMDNDGGVFTAIKGVQSTKTSLDFGLPQNMSGQTRRLIGDLHNLTYRDLYGDELLDTAKEFSILINQNDLCREEPESTGIIEANIGDVSAKDLEGVADVFDVSEISGLDRGVYGGLVDVLLKEKYAALSKKYSLVPFEKQVTYGSGGGEEAFREFEVGDEARSVDVYKSFGRYLPGVSTVKSIVENVKEDENNSYDLPDAVIVLDSSGSMPNPTLTESPGVVAGFAVARTYVSRNSEVASVNFASTTGVSGFSRDVDLVYDNLLSDQGGYSELDLKSLKQLVGGRGDVDLYFISDMMIHPGMEIDMFLEKHGLDNRVSVFQLNPFSKKKYSNCEVHPVRSLSDLPGTVFDSMRGYVK